MAPARGRAGPGATRNLGEAPANRREGGPQQGRWSPSFLMRDSRVVGLRPRRAAAAGRPADMPAGLVQRGQDLRALGGGEGRRRRNRRGHGGR
jgi:hypothetical protein